MFATLPIEFVRFIQRRLKAEVTRSPKSEEFGER